MNTSDASGSTPQAGRPPVGPKVETRLDARVLQRLDADAANQGIGRAPWLRDAVHHTLQCPLADPALPARSSQPLAEALRQVTSLADLKEWAIDPEASKGERVIAAERYAGVAQQMRAMIGTLRNSLPRQEAQAAYVQADADDPDMTRTETARAWARATAADQLDGLLDAIAMLLPLDDAAVQTRAALDDPLMDLD